MSPYFLHKSQSLFLIGQHRLSNPLESIMQEGVVELDSIIPPRQADDPVLVINHIVIIREVVLEEGELESVGTERFIDHPLVRHVE